VLALSPGLSQLQRHYTDETRDLFRILLNATSVAEANLALQVLKQIVPEKPLVTACNLREVLAALPASPFVMRVDEETLCGAAHLEKQIAVLKKTLPGDIELVATTAGNLVLDIIVRHAGEQHYWTPIPVVDDFINPEIVDLVVTSGSLLDQVIDLVKCMGIVFNPKFYLSIDDWRLEYAAAVMTGFGSIF
jgi:hypothetical protein